MVELSTVPKWPGNFQALPQVAESTWLHRISSMPKFYKAMTKVVNFHTNMQPALPVGSLLLQCAKLVSK